MTPETTMTAEANEVCMKPSENETAGATARPSR